MKAFPIGRAGAKEVQEVVQVPLLPLWRRLFCQSARIFGKVQEGGLDLPSAGDLKRGTGHSGLVPLGTDLTCVADFPTGAGRQRVNHRP